MTDPLLASKLQLPPLQRALVGRPQLMSRLQSDLTTGEGFARKLTLFSAPAGYGKTTLAADWLSAGPHPVAWLSLDEQDNDPRRFLGYLVAGLGMVDPGLGSSTRELLASPQPLPPQEMLSTLVGEMAALGARFVLALDDYHCIQAPPIHEYTNFLLEYQPPNMHLVLLTREDPPIPASRLRARNQMVEIRQADLRFSPEETHQFLSQAMGLEVSQQDTATLARRTEGWVAGLQLAGLAMQRTPNAKEFVRSFSGSHRFILDYLMDEVLGQQPAEVQDFLLKTSILDRLTAALCQAVSGRTDSYAQLIALETSNLFISSLDQTRTWFRYHRLFTELLRHRLSQQAGISVADLHRAASHWFARNDWPEEAVHHALAAEDWETAAGLISDQSDVLLRRGQISTLLAWCRRLPENIIQNDPRVCLAYAWPLLLLSQAEPAAALLTRAEALAGQEPPLLGEIAAAQAYLAQVQGDGARLVEQSERALALLAPDNLTSRGVVSLNLGLAYWHLGQMEKAEEALQQALQAGRKTRNHFAAFTAEFFLARSLAVRGQLHQAGKKLGELLETSWRTPLLALVHLDLAALSYEWNDLDQAEASLQAGLQSALQSGNPEFEIGAYLLTARLRLAQGRRGQALSAVQEALKRASLSQVPPRSRDRITALQVEFGLGTGETIQPELHSGLQVDAHPFYRFLGLATARHLLAQGRKAQASRELVPLRAMAQAAGWWYGLVVVDTLLALSAESQESAVEHIREALGLAQPQGFMRTFLDAGAQLAPVLQVAAQEGIFPEYSGQILAGLEQATVQPDRHTGDLGARGKQPPIETPPADPLTGRELEVLRLVAAGLSNRQIAEQLVVSVSTIKSHVHHISGKLGASNRTQAVAYARRLGLL